MAVVAHGAVVRRRLVARPGGVVDVLRPFLRGGAAGLDPAPMDDPLLPASANRRLIPTLTDRDSL